MSFTNTGGPAFPVTGHIELEWGMTLRDYFAAKAMQTFDCSGDLRYISMRSYEMADAMLKAREGGAA